MKALPRFVVAVSLLASVSAGAYPVFYTCDANGVADDYVDTDEVERAVLAALKSPATNPELFDACHGDANCMTTLREMLILTRGMLPVMEKIYQDRLAKIRAEIARREEDLKTDASLSKQARDLVLMATASNECRHAQMDFLAPTFTYKGHEVNEKSTGYDMFISHGVDNEYLLVSGIGSTDAKNFKNSYDHVGTVIRDAVSANVDPYAALAVSFMEAGKAEPFMTDPNPAIGLLGCAPTKIKGATYNDEDQAGIEAKEDELRKAGTDFIYNWGTFYAMTPGVPEPNATTKAIVAQMQKRKAVDGDDGIQAPGYACVQNEGAFLTDEGGKVVDAFDADADTKAKLRKDKACCMKIPYISQRAFTALANIELTNAIGNSGSPESRLQSFNGKGVIGITEKRGVGAFRYGINMKRYPQYGNQAMDFILNSFMNNPAIRKLVEDAENDYGKHPKSLICVGKKAGTYALDSDKYVENQKEMKRFTTVIDKSWSALTKKEKAMFEVAKDAKGNVIKREVNGKLEPLPSEFTFVLGMAGKTMPNLSDEENQRLQTAIAGFDEVPDGAAKWEYYRSKIYPLRTTLEQTSQKSWSRLTDEQIDDIREKIKVAPAQKYD
ncbi:MAG: hypothetical protein JST04_02055 [Bdellovibrionales bacterium]|nr:hypothetical protein [Bdellovibrionales bacterium]